MFSITVSGEQERILQHQPQRPSQVGFPDVADIGPVDADAAAVDLVETRQQVDDGCLARARGTDQRDRLPGLGLQGHILDDGHLGSVSETDMLEAHVSLHRLHGDGLRRIVHLRGCVDDLKHALGSGQRRLDGVVDVRKLAKWIG